MCSELAHTLASFSCSELWVYPHALYNPSTFNVTNDTHSFPHLHDLHSKVGESNKKVNIYLPPGLYTTPYSELFCICSPTPVKCMLFAEQNCHCIHACILLVLWFVKVKRSKQLHFTSLCVYQQQKNSSCCTLCCTLSTAK